MATDPTKLKVVKEIRRSGFFFCAAKVAGANRVFAGSSDAKVCEFDPTADKPEAKEMAGHSGYVTGVAIAGKRLVSGACDGRLVWWDLESREQVRAVDAHTKWIRGVVALPDGKVIASVADDMQTKLWNAESGELLQTLSNHQIETPHHYPSMLYAVTISPDGKFLATGDKVGHVVVSELAGGKKLAELETPVMYTWDPTQRRHSIGGIRSLAFSADGKQLAVGGMGKVGNIDHLEGAARVEVFDWQAGNRTHEFPGDRAKGLVEQLYFHPSGDWLLAAGGDNGGFVHFFDLAANKPLHQTTAPMHVYAVIPGDDPSRLYGVGNDRLVVWEMKS